MKNLRNSLLGSGLALLLCYACCPASSEPELTKSGLNSQNFVSEINGKATALYTLKNSNGMEVCITNFGGRVVSIMVPDRNDSLRDVFYNKVSFLVLIMNSLQTWQTKI